MIGEQPKLPEATVAPRSTTLESWAPATVGERRPSMRSPTISSNSMNCCWTCTVASLRNRLTLNCWPQWGSRNDRPGGTCVPYRRTHRCPVSRGPLPRPRRLLRVLPHRRPMDTEPLRNRQHARATKAESSDSFYFLVRQRCSSTSTRVPDDLRIHLSGKSQLLRNHSFDLLPRGNKALHATLGVPIGSTTSHNFRRVKGHVELPIGGHRNCPWAVTRGCPVADTNLPTAPPPGTPE